ncbi:MAG TPA: hypothetical protein VMM81_00160, partial [Acidimicrobiia bacterium]|nr:hypothetical protein [Acidimicrobiia bacterium]
MLRLKVICIGALLLLGPSPKRLHATPPSEAWSRELGGDAFLFTADSLLVTGSRVVAAGVRRNAGDVLSPATPVIFTLSEAGEQTGEIVLEGVEIRLPFLVPGIPSLTRLNDGAIVGAVQETLSSARLFELSEDGTVSWGGIIPGRIQAIVASGAEALVFTNQENSVFVTGVDRRLEIVKEASRLKAEATLVEVGTNSEASYLILTSSLLDVAPGDSSLGLYELRTSSTDQEVKPLYEAEGSGGSVAPREGGGFLLIHDVQVETKRAIRLVAFDEQRRMEWSKDVVHVVSGLT